MLGIQQSNVKMFIQTFPGKSMNRFIVNLTLYSDWAFLAFPGLRGWCQTLPLLHFLRTIEGTDMKLTTYYAS